MADDCNRADGHRVGQERTNRSRPVDMPRGIDLGPVGEVNAGRFIVFSTPSASVAGQTLNPAASGPLNASSEVAGRNDQINDVQFERNRQWKRWVSPVRWLCPSGTTTIEGRVSMSVHLTSFEHEGDVVVAVAVYPERLDDGERRASIRCLSASRTRATDCGDTVVIRASDNGGMNRPSSPVWCSRLAVSPATPSGRACLSRPVCVRNAVWSG